MEWQPIETAPKDGTKVLIWSTNEEFPGELVASWYFYNWHSTFCIGNYASVSLNDVTHWMPLPQPPSP